MIPGASLNLLFGTNPAHCLDGICEFSHVWVCIYTHKNITYMYEYILIIIYVMFMNNAMFMNVYSSLHMSYL